MIKSFLILTQGGIPLYTKTIEKVFDETLVSCFLTAIQNFAQGLSQSCINKIDMDQMTFFYAFKGPIYSIIVAEASDEVESRIYRVIAEKLGREFVKKYPVDFINKNQNDMENFRDFNEIYDEITSEFSMMLRMSHKEVLTEYFVNAASNENILGMVVYDLKKDEFIATDIPEEISRKSFESFSSMLFSFIDRLGKELKAGIINETLMRAENFWIGGFRKGTIAVFMLFSHEYFGQILPDFVTRAIS